jgi:hypothetical protein
MERALYHEAVVKDTPPIRSTEVPINDGPESISDAGFVGEKGDVGRGLPVVATTMAKTKALAGKAAARASAAEAPPKTRLAANDVEVDDDAGKKAYAAHLGAAKKAYAAQLGAAAKLHSKERAEKEEPWAWACGELTMGRLQMNDIELGLSELDVWMMSSSTELKQKFSKDRVRCASTGCLGAAHEVR